MYTENNPYGYWVTQDEIIPVIDDGQHYDIATIILSERFEVSEEKITNLPFDVYRVMFRLGYIRVVNFSGEGYGVEYRADTKHSRLQKEFIGGADIIDTVNHARRRINNR